MVRKERRQGEGGGWFSAKEWVVTHAITIIITFPAKCLN